MNIFIGCSARDNIDDIYLKDSKSIIEKITKINDINLVFGAYYKGIMATCYDEFKKNNRKVIGVTPKVYESDLKPMNCDEVIITDTTMERFNEIYKRSDVFLFLPGGIGTLSELFNVLEENIANNNKKLIIIYNKNFFYTPIIRSLHKMYEEKFIDKELSNYMVIESEEDKIIELIKKEKDENE